MKPFTERLSLFTVIWFFIHFCAIAQEIDGHELDVISYQVHLRPDIHNQSLEGNVIINFLMGEHAKKATFDCGSLTIDNVKGQNVTSFQQIDRKLVITFLATSNKAQSVSIFYHGSPTRGLVFSPESNQAYTYYFSSDWMICRDQPSDRASIKMHLTIEDSLTVISNGKLIEVKASDKKSVSYSWDQPIAVPSYTYGFVIGKFNKVQYQKQGITYNFYSNEHSEKELTTIFNTTSDMGAFFEEKSGVNYFQDTYSQVLIGNQYQEMSGFAILKESYGGMVINDSTETNLIGHEFAHQWWGNMITCKSWSHFWLNEAFATFMSAAYNEHRFGKEKYDQNIRQYFEVYEAIRSKGGDKPLIFEEWANPSRDDRNLVYFKGAYVLHLLREELGEADFWKGIKHYSRQYFGKSVVSKDFQNSMEESTGVNLNKFFNHWVYQKI